MHLNSITYLIIIKLCFSHFMLRMINCVHILLHILLLVVFFYSAGGDSAVSLQLCVESGSVRLGNEQLQRLSPQDANKSVQAD